jgi:DNA (cytosine-5)-methyltransferase 1
MTTQPLRLGSLFAGIGGFDLGFQRAGFVTAWAVEIDPACQRVLRYHFPEAHIEADVANVGAHNLEPVDVITFGSPCQDLSVAGKRGGFAGERSGLYFEAIRIIRELRPAVAIWENVPGALSSNSGRDFGFALDALADIGALDIGWAVLDAQWFGVAQRRRRVFVVADFRGQRAGEILALADGLSGHPAPRRETGQGVAGTLGGGAGERGWAPDTDRMTFVPFDMTQVTSVANRQRLEAGREAPSLHAAGGVHVITAFGIGSHAGSNGEASNESHAAGGPVGMGIVEEGVPALRSGRTQAIAAVRTANTNANGHGVAEDVAHTLDGANGQAIAFTNRGYDKPSESVADSFRAGSHGALPMAAATLTSNGDAQNEHRDEHGLIATAWVGSYGGGGGSVSDVSPTLQASRGEDDRGVRNPLVSHQAAVRRLTPVECCRLQAFPDNFLDLDPPLADSTKYRMLGNAVCCAVSEWLAARIATALAGSSGDMHGGA